MKKTTLSGFLYFSSLALALAGPVAFAATNGPGTESSNISAGTAQAGYEADKTTNANANSVGEFSIEAGKLTLDKVPNMHFAKADKSNPTVSDISNGVTLKLVDGNITPNAIESSKNFDGNSTLNLSVSDFRGDDQNGWKVYATVSDFKKDDSHSLSGTTLKMTAKQGSKTDTGVAVKAPSEVSIPATGDAGVVVNAASGKGTLTNNFTFDNTTSLTIANQAAQSGLYQAKLTWSLANVPTPSGNE